MTTEPLVRLEGVRFRPDGAERPVLDGLDLDIRKGEWVLVMGPSGSGKTTLALTLNGTVPHSITGEFAGTVTVAGRVTAGTPVAALATTVGMVFQDPDGQIVHETVRDEVYFGLENLRWSPTEIVQEAHRALDQVGMLDLLDAEIMSLSGGQKQRVSLASVLALSPEVIVLDEPTANLDPQGMRDVFSVIDQIHRQRGVTILMVEHHVDELASMVDRLVVIENGRVALEGRPRRIFSAVAPEASRRGLWLPQVSELVHAVTNEASGADLPITVEDCVERVAPVLSTTSINARSEPVAPDTGPVLEIRDLRFTYRGAREATLRGVSLALPAGGITAIVGPNGSGKTTLAKCITRINQPPPGTIFLEGRDITRMSAPELTGNVGYVFQNPDHQFVTDRTYDELAYSLRVRRTPPEEVDRRVRRMLDLMELSGRDGDSPFGLSVGERRRLSVATMLILEQKLVILDEPTIGQDLARSEALFSILDRLCHDQGTSMVFITHDMRLVADWCRRAIVMSDGVVRYDGPTASVFDDPERLVRAHLVAPPIVEVTSRLRERGHPVPPGVISVGRMRAWMGLAQPLEVAR